MPARRAVNHRYIEETSAINLIRSMSITLVFRCECKVRPVNKTQGAASDRPMSDLTISAFQVLIPVLSETLLKIASDTVMIKMANKYMNSPIINSISCYKHGRGVSTDNQWGLFSCIRKRLNLGNRG